MLEKIKKEFKELEKKLSDPEIIKDREKLTKISKRHSELKDIMDLINSLEKIKTNIAENKEIINNESDSEISEMANAEIIELKEKEEAVNKKINEELNPSDPNDKKNAIIEIRAGTGGDESALFVAELFRMYSKFAETKGFKINILNSNRIGIGGFKEIIFEVNGKNAYGIFKWEAGIHRVQRIPETEKQGRVHTSAVTVAVLHEAKEIDLKIENNDLRIDTFASSGPGGQSVNTTNSAVRITHIPSGLVAQSQDQKDQHQNKDKAMRILRSRLLQKIEEEENLKEKTARKEMIGTGDRSGKIRTYNFPQDRITDHRIKKSWSQIDRIMNGEIEIIIEELKKNQKEN
jgi:peptide chain release factor 1